MKLEINPNLSGVIAIILWSISPLLIIGSGDTPPFLLAFLTLAVACLSLLIKNLCFDKISLDLIAKQPLKVYGLISYGIGGYLIFWFLAFKNALAFEANTLNYLWPLLLVFFTMAISKNLELNKIIGIILGFSGCALLFLQSNDSGFSQEYLTGYIFAIIAAFIWSSYSTVTKYISFPNYAMTSAMAVPCLFFLILHIIFEQIYTPNIAEIIAIVALGFTRISFNFWDYAMKHANINLISSLSYFIPIFSTIFLVAFSFAPRNEIVLLSAILVLVGCLISNKGLLKRK